VSSGWLGHLLREFSMRKFMLFTAAAASLAAIPVGGITLATPAAAAPCLIFSPKVQCTNQTAAFSNGVNQSNAQHQSQLFGRGIQLSSNTAVGVPFAFFNGGNEQSVEQTQRGFTNQVFPFFHTQVQVGNNFEIFSFLGNSQSITQEQNAFILAAFGPAQIQTANNISAFGSFNDQSADQTQNLGALVTFGPAQVQNSTNVSLIGSGNGQHSTQTQNELALVSVGGPNQVQNSNNVVLVGSGNDQSTNQTQNQAAFVAAGTNQVQLADNVVVAGNNNDQSITQTQTNVAPVAAGPQQTQSATNVVVAGSGNSQTSTQDQ
jgi:hypothetical protein